MRQTEVRQVQKGKRRTQRMTLDNTQISGVNTQMTKDTMFQILSVILLYIILSPRKHPWGTVDKWY